MRRRSAEESESADDRCAVSTYLSEFAAVSIKMAKEQNLSLNPYEDIRSVRTTDVLSDE